MHLYCSTELNRRAIRVVEKNLCILRNNICTWGSCYKDSPDCLSHQLMLAKSRMTGEKNPSLSISPQTGKILQDCKIHATAVMLKILIYLDF